MTGFQRPGVAIARPYAARLPGIFGDHADDACVRGTPGQRFRMIADAMTSRRQARQDTANAVRVRALPGFKSPSLRSSPAPYSNTWGGGRAASLDP